MKISDLLKLSTDNLKRRKGRTILTVLGVIIGTCSIVMMMSIGEAINKSNEDMINNMGDLTQITVYNYSGNPEQEPITDDVIAQFQAMEGVKIATPIYQSQYLNNIVVKGGNSGKYEWNGWVGDSVVGMYREAMPEYGYELLDGRYVDSKDKAFTVIAGEFAAYEFVNPKRQWPHNRVDAYPNENGVIADPFVDIYKDKLVMQAVSYEEDGETVEKNIKVVGTVKEDWNKGYETYGGFIMDMEDLIELEEEYIKANKIRVSNKNKAREYSRAVVKVTDVKKVEGVIAAIEDMGYNTSSPTDWLDDLEQQSRTIQLILGGLGSIAMLVASISIANTMTMAIYERRREIGIMKVLGCEVGHIRAMFLTESAGIGFLGGVVGLVICYGLSFLLNYIATYALGGGYMVDGVLQKTYISIIPLWLAVFGVGFSTLVGIVSGYIPANKAVKISALTAIKNE